MNNIPKDILDAYAEYANLYYMNEQKAIETKQK